MNIKQNGLIKVFFVAMVFFMFVKVEIGMFLFMIPFVFFFTLRPFISIFISNEKIKKIICLVYFIIRIFLYYKFSLLMFGLEFASVFLFGFIINPILCLICGKKYNDVLNENFAFVDKYSDINNTNATVNEVSAKETTEDSKGIALSSKFNPIYDLPENDMVEQFIEKELIKLGIDKNTKLIPAHALKRKKILNIIFSVLLFTYISLIFFHFPIYTYIIGIIILFIFFKLTRKYNLIKYLKKEIESRPSEKISNIIMNTKSTFVRDNNKGIFAVMILLAIVLPLMIFKDPRIMYEKVDNGYAVRFYTFGLTNYKTAVIPETYKNENVVSLRGNTFSNMPFLKSITLPNTIKEIRGQAFKNDILLTEVNIPTHLEYLGGGAFYNAKSIKSIELPDTLTYLGGESFYKATSLEKIKLSNNLTEIRGNSFEDCVSLKSITIPDKVTRIGGHAFYGDESLTEVIISKNSQLKEIGSSAFRKCDSLYNIILPGGVSVNERAFKESPTNIEYFDATKIAQIDLNKDNGYGYMLSYGYNYEEVNDFTFEVSSFYKLSNDNYRYHIKVSGKLNTTIILYKEKTTTNKTVWTYGKYKAVLKDSKVNSNGELEYIKFDFYY